MSVPLNKVTCIKKAAENQLDRDERECQCNSKLFRKNEDYTAVAP